MARLATRSTGDPVLLLKDRGNDASHPEVLADLERMLAVPLEARGRSEKEDEGA